MLSVWSQHLTTRTEKAREEQAAARTSPVPVTCYSFWLRSSISKYYCLIWLCIWSIWYCIDWRNDNFPLIWFPIQNVYIATPPSPPTDTIYSVICTNALEGGSTMCIAHPICFPSTFCQIRGVRDTSVDAVTLLNCSSVILRLTCALPWTAQIRSWRTTLCFVLQYFEWHDSTKCVAFLQIMSDARPSVTVALPQIVAQLCRKWKTWATSLATDWAFSALHVEPSCFHY